MRTNPIIFLFLSMVLCLLMACQSEKKNGQGSTDGVISDSTEITLEMQVANLTRELERSPDNYALYHDRSMLYYQLGKTDEAVSDIRKALDLNAEDPDLHYLRGFYGMAQGDTSLAFYRFELAANYGSADPDNYYQMGQIHFFKKEYEKALKQYEGAGILDSLNPIYPFASGFLEQSRGNYQKAIAHYEASLDKYAGFEKALFQLHDLYLDVFKDEKKALAYNQRVLDKNVAHPLANYNLANSHYRKALALKRNPNQQKAYQDEVNNAVTHYTIAIKKGTDKGFAHPYYFRGDCYLQGERYDLALKDFEKVIEIDPNYARAHFYIGSIHEFYQDKAKALEHYEKAAKADPSFVEARQAAAELR